MDPGRTFAKSEGVTARPEAGPSFDALAKPTSAIFDLDRTYRPGAGGRI